MSGLSLLLFSLLFVVCVWLFLPGLLDKVFRLGRKAALNSVDKPDALADTLFERWSGRT